MTNPKESSSLINTELAGCRIAEEISYGGMATVYRAYQTRLERWVAIKVLHHKLLANREALARFRREARAVAALRHPNILTFYDYGEEQGLAFIVMEHVAGGTLIIHRDVKPANILFPRDDWPLLSDFGLVKLLTTRQRLTLPGVGLGTPFYTAPEQMLGKAVDHRADIYALALILYEMVTGRLPFSGNTPMKMMMERLRQSPLPPRQVNEDVPHQLESILMRALEQNPDDRFGMMEDLVAALKELKRTTSPTRDAARTTQVIPRDKMVIGPRMSVTGTGIPLFLPPKDEILIGRSIPYGDVVPDIDFAAHGGEKAGVSRLHATLSPKGERWYLADLHSTNGTFVNGQPVTPGQPMELKDGDSIRFGSMGVTLHSK
jgi:serine/threonine protein kinase